MQKEEPMPPATCEHLVLARSSGAWVCRQCGQNVNRVTTAA